jgi:lipopolysaccharide export system protein LptA
LKVLTVGAALFLTTVALTFSADLFRFRADRMSGGSSSGKKITILSGRAEVVSEDLVLRADRIELSGDNNRFVDCSGSVSGTDEKKGIHFRSERLRYDRELKIARLEGDSTLEDKENSVVAKGRFIEYNDEAGTTILQVGVRIFKDELVCRSEYALYRRKEKLLELTGLPVVFREGDEFRSDRMRVDLETDDISMEGAVTGALKEKKKPAEGEKAPDKPLAKTPEASDASPDDTVPSTEKPSVQEENVPRPVENPDAPK